MTYQTLNLTENPHTDYDLICLDEFHRTGAPEWGAAVDRLLEMNKQAVPMGRFGRPEEVSYLALFLATDMARYITGAALVVDGGFTGGDQNNAPWGTPDPRNLNG
jgi:NAD(P)-dependent dehydrogenase (short-subunit alcohol dehydrogenase family)